MSTPLLTPAGRSWAERHVHLTVARLALAGHGKNHKVAVAICNQYAAGDSPGGSINRLALASYRPSGRPRA